MSAGKGEVLKFGERQPLATCSERQCIAICDAMKHLQGYPVAGDRMFDGVKSLERLGVKTECGFRDSAEVSFTIELGVGEFPKVSIHHTRGSLANEVASISFDDKSIKVPGSSRGAFRKVWKQMCSSLAMSDAIAFERAIWTARIFRRANERAQFHERLVKVRAFASIRCSRR